MIYQLQGILTLEGTFDFFFVLQLPIDYNDVNYWLLTSFLYEVCARHDLDLILDISPFDPLPYCSTIHEACLDRNLSEEQDAVKHVV